MSTPNQHPTSEQVPEIGLRALGLAVALSIGACPLAFADGTLEYLVSDKPGHAGKPQPILIKSGKIMVKNAGGDDNVDVLYNRNGDALYIIDHHKRTYMSLDQQEVNQVSRQAEQLQPLLQGFGEQLGKLSPQQKAKWQNLLGDKVSIDDIADAAKPAKATKVVKSGTGKNVAGIPCDQMDVLQGSSKTGEFCIADPGRLKLSGDDYETVRSLLRFSESLANKTQGLAGQFGVKIPSVNIHDLVGIPIEMKDFSGRNQSSVTLNRVVTSEVDPSLMQLPEGYRQKPLTPWK